MTNQSNQEQFRQHADFLAAMNKQIGILADLSSEAISRPPSVGRDQLLHKIFADHKRLLDASSTICRELNELMS